MRRTLSTSIVPWFLAAALPVLPSASGGELESRIQEYTALKNKARGGNPEQRTEKAKTLKPILTRIAKLESPEALVFLLTEYEKESPEIAAACVEPLLLSPGEKVLEILLAGFPKRHRTVKLEVLSQLAKTKRDLAPAESALIGLLNTEAQPEVRKEIPPVLGRLPTVAAARALVNSLAGRDAKPTRDAKGKNRGAGEARDFERRVVGALKDQKSDAVKAWLADEAFAGATGMRLEVLLEVVGDLKLEEARPEVEKHLDDADEAIAVRALEAILKLGAAPSADRLRSVLTASKRSVSFKIEALDALAAGGGANVAAVLEAARSSDPETRAIALGSLARVPGANEQAVQGMLEGLRDSEAVVRGSALRALRNVRHKKMVQSLIDLLGSEKDEKLKIDTLQFLLAITGKNMGLATEDWQKWWDVAEQKFEFAKGEIKAATASQSRDLKYFGVEISSRRLGFLLDNSGSMREEVEVYLLTPEEKKAQEKAAAGGTGVPARPEGADAKGQEGKDGGEKKKIGRKSRAKKIDVLKQEMGRVVGELPKDTLLNIITFAATYKPWQESLQPLAGGGRERALGFVKEMQTGPGTNVFDTLEFALRDKRVDTIFLLTDGLPTSGRFLERSAILREVQALNRLRGVVINCIAFGEESDFLKELAKQNGGVYRFVNSY